MIVRLRPGGAAGSPLSRGRRPVSRNAGFSLLEVLVAFVILALVGTALFRLFGGAIGNAGAAEEWSRGVLLAQTRLALAASAEPLRETTEGGTEDDGRIRWESKVTAYTPQGLSPDLERASESMPTRLYRIEVAVQLASQGGRQRTVSLETLRIGAKDPR